MGLYKEELMKKIRGGITSGNAYQDKNSFFGGL